jgi:hypothetical protein
MSSKPTKILRCSDQKLSTSKLEYAAKSAAPESDDATGGWGDKKKYSILIKYKHRQQPRRDRDLDLGKDMDPPECMQ